MGQFSVLDPDMSSTATYALLSSADMNKFRIEDDRLLTNSALDYEEQIFYNLVVLATDDLAATTMQELVIILLNQNEVPTGIRLLTNEFKEHAAEDTRISILIADDPDTEDTFIYTLIGGTGSEDNDVFNIRNNELRNRMPFDFEVKNSYQVRISASDQEGQTTEAQFVIQITDINEPPTGLSFSPQLLPENQPLGTLVGTLSGDGSRCRRNLYLYTRRRPR